MALSDTKIFSGTTGITMRSGNLGEYQLAWCRKNLPFFAVCERDAIRSRRDTEFQRQQVGQSAVLVSFPPQPQPAGLLPYVNDPASAGSIY